MNASSGKYFRSETTNSAVYTENRIMAALGDKTPDELRTGLKPDVDHIKIFGCSTMAHKAREKREKWEKKSGKRILNGCTPNVKDFTHFY